MKLHFDDWEFDPESGDLERSAFRSSRVSGHKNFWLIDLGSGIERQLTNLPPDVEIRDFDIDPAGGRIVFDRVAEDLQIALVDRAH